MATIYKEFMTSACENQAVTILDIEIRKCIETNPEQLKESIEYNGNWQKYLSFARERRNVLEWYQFDEKAEILEIDAGNGALTGLLCEKCKHVTATVFSPYRAETIAKRYEKWDNLDIYVGAIGSIRIEKKFDYIVMLGNLEGILKDRRELYLNKIITMLKPDGIILCTVENRFSARYLCGAREPHTGKPFDGINQYPQGTSGYAFERSELCDLFKQVGLSEQKMFYPIPDCNVTQAVFSDDVIPKEGDFSFLKTAYWGYDTLVANENELLDASIRNGSFRFVAPSFLLECSRMKLKKQEAPGTLACAVDESLHKNFEVRASALERINKSIDIKKNEEECLGISEREYLQLDKIKNVQLMMLKEIHRICQMHNIDYYVFRGTLLGAIRHNGYIPWDDDIDVAMPRKDFEIFKNVVQKELSEEYFFQSCETDEMFFRGSMCRIRNINTTGIEDSEIGTGIKAGIWIDILILDNVFIEEKKQKWQKKKLTFWSELLQIKTSNINIEVAFKEEGWKKALSKILSKRYLLKRYERICKACSDKETNSYAVFSKYISKSNFVTYIKSDFERKIEWKFEDIKVWIPDGYEHILRKSIGKYYMHYPKVEKRVPKHTGIMDATVSYQRFQGIWSNEIADNLVLIGEQTIMDSFVELFGTNKKISYDQEIKAENAKDSDIVICSDEYEKYVVELEKKKIDNYYIFVSTEIEVIRSGKRKKSIYSYTNL